ncbi:MAG: pyridoxamine 5'-phosphate oxidase family protein [Bacteroidota bacterium]
MTKTFYDELKDELQKGAYEKNHPFRYFTLGTVGLDQLARLRTVVLRQVTDDLVLTFYTDKRSKKITHMKENDKVSLLFYHPKKLFQLKIEGIATIESDKKSLRKVWNAIGPKSKMDYITTIAPGSTIKSLDAITYLEKKDFFCMVEVKPFKIEYLKLNRPKHIRVRFSQNKGQWTGEFLVP